VREKRACRDGRDAWGRGESLLFRAPLPVPLRALCIHRKVSRRTTLSANREAEDPRGAVLGILSADDADAEIASGKKQAAKRVVRDAARPERPALDEEIRPPCGDSQLGDLRPVPSLSHRSMNICDRLALDRGVGNEIVAAWERANVDSDAEAYEDIRDPGGLFVHVNDNPQHTRSLPDERRHYCNEMATIGTTSDFARVRC
jgi:hypothetical protein